MIMTLLQTIFTFSNVGIGSVIILGVTTLGIKINSNTNKRFSRKADKSVVDDKFKIMHEKINEKANKESFNIIKDDLNFIKQKLMNL